MAEGKICALWCPADAGRRRLARELLGTARYVPGDAPARGTLQGNLRAGRRGNVIGVSLDRA
jgi:hypothetical protein